MAYQLITGNSFTQVLFSGQDALPEPGRATPPTTRSASLSCSIVCKSLAYGLSLSAFRGGPVFPSMFIGAALGIAVSGLPGMSLAPAIGMGIGAMCAAMLRLPLTSTLLATLLLGADGVSVTPAGHRRRRGRVRRHHRAARTGARRSRTAAGRHRGTGHRRRRPVT